MPLEYVALTKFQEILVHPDHVQINTTDPMKQIRSLQKYYVVLNGLNAITKM